MELRISYVSESGDRLKDLGNGRVLIRNPNRTDRVLDRNTGKITARPSLWLRLRSIVFGYLNKA